MSLKIVEFLFLLILLVTCSSQITTTCSNYLEKRFVQTPVGSVETNFFYSMPYCQSKLNVNGKISHKMECNNNNGLKRLFYSNGKCSGVPCSINNHLTNAEKNALKIGQHTCGDNNCGTVEFGYCFSGKKSTNNEKFSFANNICQQHNGNSFRVIVGNNGKSAQILSYPNNACIGTGIVTQLSVATTCKKIPHIFLSTLPMQLMVINPSGCRNGVNDVIFIDNKIVGCSGKININSHGMFSNQAKNMCNTRDGWYLCPNESHVKQLGLNRAICDTKPPQSTFWATRQKSSVSHICDGKGENDIYGCGTIDIARASPGSCGALSWRISSNIMKSVVGGKWRTNTKTNNDELRTVFKGDGQGGVMCCNNANTPVLPPIKCPTTSSPITHYNGQRRRLEKILK